MAVIKNFLLLLSFCALYQCNSEPRVCSTTGIVGRVAYPIRSQITKLIAFKRMVPLQIPDGRNHACPLLDLPLLVGQEVVACDTQVSPRVYFNSPHTAVVARQGPINEEASTFTVYYCDKMY